MDLYVFFKEYWSIFLGHPLTSSILSFQKGFNFSCSYDYENLIFLARSLQPQLIF